MTATIKNVTGGGEASGLAPADVPAPEFWRRSAVEAFLQCTEYQNDSGSAAAFGSAFHLAAAMYTRHCFERGFQTDWTEVARIAAIAFAHTGGMHPDQLEDLVTLVDHFAHTHVLSPEGVLALEEPLVVDSGLTNPVTGRRIFWTGQPDLLEREPGGDPDEDPAGILLTDYKTNRAVAFNLFQGRFYAMLIFLSRPSAQRVRVRFDYVRKFVQGRKGEEPVELVYERGDLDAWWKSVEFVLLERLKLQGKEPTGCMACEYCRKRGTCGEALTPFDALPETMEEAIDIARAVLRAKHVTRSANARLKAFFMQDRAPVAIDLGGGTEMEMGVMPPRKPQLRIGDPLGTVSHVKQAGFDIPDLLVTWVDKKKIPKELIPGLVEAGKAHWAFGPDRFVLRKGDASTVNATEERLEQLVHDARALYEDYEADEEEGGEGEEERGEES